MCPEKKETKKFFAVKLGRFWWTLVYSFLNKFAAKICKRFPPHLNNVSTLPCETWNVHHAGAITTLSEEETPEFIPFTCYGDFTCSPTYWISLRQWDPYINAFNTLSGVRNMCWILPKLHILCTSAVKWNCDKNYNWLFTCCLFSSASKFMEAKKLAIE